MKKSEALEKIKNKLWLLGVADLSDQDAESMLKFVEEELEMPPPLYVRGLSVDEMDELGANNIGFYTGYEHIYDWEPEE